MDDYDETESFESSDSDEGDSSSLAELAREIGGDTSATAQSQDAAATDTSRTSLSDLAESVRAKRPAADEDAENGDTIEWEFSDAGTDPFDASVELDSEAVAVLDRVADETSVLLVGPSRCAMARELCGRLMAPTSPSNAHRQLVVSVDTPREDKRKLLQSVRRDSVETQVLVDAQSYTTPGASDDYDDSVTVLNVATSRDLRRIGILTTKLLTEWTDADVPSTVCFHTLSALLDAVDETERVFRFVHILHGRIRASDTRSHFHLDPTRHDEQTIRTFFSLFDTILKFDADGTLELL